MDLSNLQPAVGSVQRKTRIGRGPGSGKGGTSTRGHKGAKSRSGYKHKVGFEGGQMPLQRRLPKFGFKNINRVEYKPVNLAILQQLAEAKNLEKIGLEELRAAGFANRNQLVKILGVGTITRAINVEAHAFSKAAQAAIEAAYKEGEAKLKGNGKSVPALSVLKTPLRDGDAERPDDEAYKNAYFVNANATSAPGIVDADLNPILTRSEVYSGVYGRASITFYAFNSSGNKGIACGLNNLQKIRDGEPLGGKASAESDFATDDDEDFLN